MQQSNKNTTVDYAQFLFENAQPSPTWQGQGLILTWGAQWADDSLKLTREQVYSPAIKITGKRVIFKIRNGKRTPQTVFDISGVNTQYEMTNMPVVNLQLVKAGFRLAQILDAIFSHV